MVHRTEQRRYSRNSRKDWDTQLTDVSQVMASVSKDPITTGEVFDKISAGRTPKRPETKGWNPIWLRFEIL